MRLQQSLWSRWRGQLVVDCHRKGHCSPSKSQWSWREQLAVGGHRKALQASKSLWSTSKVYGARGGQLVVGGHRKALVSSNQSMGRQQAVYGTVAGGEQQVAIGIHCLPAKVNGRQCKSMEGAAGSPVAIEKHCSPSKSQWSYSKVNGRTGGQLVIHPLECIALTAKVYDS